MRYLYLSRRLQRWQGILDNLGVSAIDFQDCAEPEYAAYNYDSRNLVRPAVMDAFGPVESMPDFSTLFPGVAQLPKKLWALLGQPAEMDLYPAMKLVAWVDSLRWPEVRVSIIAPPTPFRDSYFRRTTPPLRNYYPRWLALLSQGVAGLERGARILLARTRSGRAQSAPPSGPAVPSLPAAHWRVAYFPHQGVSYGRIFQKDHFYIQDDPASPLARSNMLHVEILDRLVASQAEELVETYSMEALPLELWVSVPSLRELLSDALNYGRFMLMRPQLCLRLRLAAYVFLAYAKFRRYRRLLEPLVNLKLALVGYEIMFPKTLSMALESRGVRTLAVQERFMHTYCRGTCGYFLDTYLVSTELAQNEIGRQWHRSVRDLRTIGFIRSDLLVQYRSEDREHYCPPDRKLVVAFDYNSPRTLHDSQTEALVNWNTNRHFLRDLIELAGRYPDFHIVIRGKDDAWCSLPAFSDLYDLICRIPNIEVNRDYTRFEVSYRLAAHADLVIAKHTSIADECLAAGKSVIVHDYSPNAPSSVAGIFGYPGLPIFVHSLAELLDAVERYRRTGHTLNSEQRKRLEAVMGPYFDGHVRLRLQEVLHEALNS